MKTNSEIIQSIQNKKTRGAWDKAVSQYALDLLESLDGEEICKSNLLNGAQDWKQYSEGGCSLIYDSDIAERVCNPSELTRTRGGELQPNSRETWLDVQSRALHQAYKRIIRHARS